MNRKGLFGPIIVLIILGMLIWVWAIIMPNVTPLIGGSIQHTQASGLQQADGTEFFLRMIPWAVPIILVLGFLWLMVRG